jgi:hypothetical protein
MTRPSSCRYRYAVDPGLKVPLVRSQVCRFWGAVAGSAVKNYAMFEFLCMFIAYN